MKIRKLAALGVAAAMAAMPVAFAAVHSENLPTNRDWYLQSKIVVGAHAATSDVIAAADIAAAVASLAYKKAEISGGSVEDAKVKIETPGQIVIGGQGYHYDDEKLDYSASEFPSGLELGKAKIPTLKENEDITVKYRASKDDSWDEDDATYTQKIVVDKNGIDIKKYVDDSKFSLKMVIPDDKIHFKTEVKSLDIPVGKPYSESGKTLDKFEIDILGQKYKVTKLNVDSSGSGSIEIATYSEEKSVNVGDSVQLGGYTVKVAGVYGEDEPYAVLELYDSQGNLISKDKVKEGETADFDEVDVKLEEAVPGDNGYAKLELKSDHTTIDLTSGSGSKSDFPVDDWALNVTVNIDNNKITGITFDVVYDDSQYDDAEDGIDVGGKLMFPGDAGYGIVFAGLTSETMHSFKIDGKDIMTLDKDGDPVTVKLVEDKVAGKDFTDGASKIYTFSDFLNGKDVAVRIFDYNAADDTFKVAIDYDYSGDEDEFSADGETTGKVGLKNWITIPVDVTDQDDVDLAVYVDDSDGSAGLTQNDRIYLAFASNNSSLTKDSPYKVVVDWSHILPGGDDYNIVDINIDTLKGTGNDVVIPVRLDEDKYTYKELKLGDDGDDVTVAGTMNLDADSDSDSAPDSAILQDGTEVYVKSSDTVEISVPEDVRKVDVFFGIPAQTEESSSVMELGVGEEIPGTKYKIVDITGVSKIEGTYYEKVVDFNPVGFGVLDNEVTSSDNLIVVGGWNANEVAKKIKEQYPEIEQELSSDKVLINKYTVDGQEMVLVAGWEAPDTRNAAAQFIDWLRQNVQ